MTTPAPRLHTSPVGEENQIEPSGADIDAPDAEGLNELSEETGIDLTDASDLDADNVPADEEFDRVKHAPD